MKDTKQEMMMEEAIASAELAMDKQIEHCDEINCPERQKALLHKELKELYEEIDGKIDNYSKIAVNSKDKQDLDEAIGACKVLGEVLQAIKEKMK